MSPIIPNGLIQKDLSADFCFFVFLENGSLFVEMRWDAVVKSYCPPIIFCRSACVISWNPSDF
jgi:hypothetical protein